MRIAQMKPADIFPDQKDLYCEHCGKNLMNGDEEGIFVLCHDKDLDHNNEPIIFKDLYVCCKGKCDIKMRNKYETMGLYGQDWESLDDICIPSVWITNLMSYLNAIYQTNNLNNAAFEKLKDIFLKTFPYVARNLSDEEKGRVKNLIQNNLL